MEMKYPIESGKKIFTSSEVNGNTTYLLIERQGQIHSCPLNKTTNSKSSASKSKQRHKQHTSLLVLSILMILISNVSCVLVHQVRFIATKSGRTDYALVGETIELSCHYIMKDEAEDIKQLVWSKDGKNFLKYRKNKPGLEVFSYTFKGHVDATSKYSHIIINNVTIDMHGKYKCTVKTDLGVHEMEQDLVVISQPGCKLNDWRVTSDPSQCREVFQLDCRNMFPKPVSSCGLWNSRTDKFIRALLIDISEEEALNSNRVTYRVKYSDRFDLKVSSNGSLITSSDLFQFAGHLVFKCDISVLETSWKLSLSHRMFDYSDGCLLDPLETIARLRSNYTRYTASRLHEAGYVQMGGELEMQPITNLKYEYLSARKDGKLELNCWRKPKIGSYAKLACVSKSMNQFRLAGASLLKCGESGWFPVKESNIDKKTALYQAHKTARLLNSSRNNSSTRGDFYTELKQTTGLNRTQERRNTPISTTSIHALDTNDLDDNQPMTIGSNGVQELETIPAGVSDELEIPHGGSMNPDHISMTPSELVALLPTCIQPARRQRPFSDRLPLLDDGMRMLESSSPERPNSRYKQKQQQQTEGSIFNFYSSSSIGPSQFPLSPSVVIVFSLITILFMILTDLDYHFDAHRWSSLTAR